jgi:class 3 adenylate cyclase
MERRLAAVLAVDMAGYSRLMEIDEDGTLARLRTHRIELIDPAIIKNQGNIIKTTGDGMLVEQISAKRSASLVQISDNKGGLLPLAAVANLMVHTPEVDLQRAAATHFPSSLRRSGNVKDFFQQVRAGFCHDNQIQATSRFDPLPARRRPDKTQRVWSR